ncbi:hypothetical protein [Streptomyces sp. NPDC058678]|uniref:hypothetical protein n=1 Tax=Streptomyces sp. NPDC058678 TaxID=3346595 RepID=UPI00364C6FD1
MRAHYARAAKALDVRVEPGGEFWGWAARTPGALARTATGQPAWLRLVSSPEDKAAGKLWDGALDAQLDGRRPVLLAVHDAVDDGTAYRAELSATSTSRSCPSSMTSSCRTPGGRALTETLEKVAAADTDRVAVRQQYMDRAIPEFVGIPAPAVTCWTAAHSDLHWANVTAPLRILDWEGWGALRKGSTPPRSTPTRCSRRTSPPASAPPSPSWVARPASPPMRPCAPNCCRPWPAATTSRFAARRPDPQGRPAPGRDRPAWW